MLKALVTPKLTWDEKASLYKYTSGESYTLNDNLRIGIDLTSEQKYIVQNLDTALDKIPYYFSQEPLNRSLNFRSLDDEVDFINKALAQGYIQENSYTSSSAGMVYDPGDILRVVILKSHSGHDLRSINAEEGEVLFKRNTRFDVLRLYQKNGNHLLR